VVSSVGFGCQNCDRSRPFACRSAPRTIGIAYVRRLCSGLRR